MNVEIRFTHSQVGMFVEGRRVGDIEWLPVQLIKHGTHKTRHYGWGVLSSVLSTNADEKAYLATLDAKGISYKVVR